MNLRVARVATCSTCVVFRHSSGAKRRPSRECERAAIPTNRPLAQGAAFLPCYPPTMEERECPLCGDRMHIETRETVSKVPGTSQEVRRTTQEWVCRECDYFEEIDEAVGNQ